MSQARGNNHERCVYPANYHHDQLGLLLGKMGASKICMLQTYFTQWASDLYTNSCWSLVKE